jgi:outer membrane protein
MKNLSLALNVILLVAVSVLYYFQFSAQKPENHVGTSIGKDLRIAYIKSDTVLKYYEYFKLNRDKFEAKGKRMDQDLKSRAQSLQNEFETYQRNANSLTMGQARAVEEDLAKKRQNLQLYQESLNQEMLVDQNKMTKDLYDRVTAYLKTYGDARGLQVVLKNDASSDLLYGSDSLDISSDVIKGLNELYKAELTAPAARKDSTATKKK